MRRRRSVIAVAVVLIVGLAALLFAWRLWQPPRSFVTANELDYLIEYEVDSATDHTHQSNPDRDGKEYIAVIVQGHYSVMILDGNLTVNRERRGTVKKGDRIRVTLDWRVWVNGTERRP